MPTRPVRAAAALLTTALAGIHVYWAAGGQAGWDAALPQNDEGQRLFVPAPAATLTVAGALAGMGTVALNADDARMRWPLRLTTVVFLLRAIGDGQSVGLTRQRREGTFARHDARLYTPLCLLLAAMYGGLALRLAQKAEGLGPGGVHRLGLPGDLES